MPTRSVQQGQIKIIRPTLLAQFPWLICGFSTRVGGRSRVYGKGALNLGFTKEDSRAAVERNRDEFVRELISTTGARSRRSAWPLITLRQIHSDLIHAVDYQTEPTLAGDGMVTQTRGLLLAIQTADCLPIILVDAKRHAVGILHAGWRGTVKRIVEKGVGELRGRFGSRPGDLKAVIGPGIHGCCYDVGPEVREKFESQFPYAEKLFRVTEEPDPVREKYPMLFLTARAPGHSELPRKIHLDLVEANRRQLLAAGVSAGNIQTSDLCTNCRTDLLFSYRGEKGKTGRMMGVVGVGAGA